MRCLMDLPGEWEMTTFDGGWIAEIRKHTTPVTENRIVSRHIIEEETTNEQSG